MTELMKFDERIIADHGRIAGLDEAGRGALAGPVFVGCLSVPVNMLREGDLSSVNDSKQLSGEIRNELFDRLANKEGVGLGIGMARSGEVDKFGINDAADMAASRALSALCIEASLALLDKGLSPALGVPARELEKGDERSFHVAGASILAKVSRDRYMRLKAGEFEEYGWASNVGYGTEEHRKSIDRYGLSPLHRKSYKIT